MRVRLLNKPKPNNCTESNIVNVAGYMERKKRVIPEEILPVGGNRVRNP
jgi:hypothetical protein